MEEPSISEFQDELILKIFSLLPLYEESIATRLLNRLRMEGPWKLVPNVSVFDDSYKSFVNFMSFVYASLLFNESQILERFHLMLNQKYSASDINVLVKFAVNRSVRKLRIQTFENTLELPSCLSSCVTLKSLILRQLSIEVVPSCFRLPSLKSLHLFSVEFSGDVSLASLLQSCPGLEYLVVRDVKFKTVPRWFQLSSLRSLHLLSISGCESVASMCPFLEDLVVKQSQVFNHYEPTLITCRTLKTLILRELTISVVPAMFCLPSLKTMHLLSVGFTGGESVASLLRICPVLEDLVVKQTQVTHSNECTLSSCRTLKTLTLSELSIKVALPWFRLPLLKTLHLLSVKFETIASFLPICPLLEYLVVDQSKEDGSVVFKEVPHWFRLPSLKSLHLLSVKFSGDDSVAKLIRNCPVLEDLVINKTRDDNVMIFNIKAFSLRSLSIDNSIGNVKKNHGFVINAPSLEKMDFKDTFSNFLVFEHMPEVTEANVQVLCGHSNMFIGSLTSARLLSLCCLSSETPYPSGTTFPYLEHLELCTRCAGWANLLFCILKDAPTLKYLKLKPQHGAHYNGPMILWKKTTAVPECLSTHLEIMEWRQYEGTKHERNVAAYVLANATCLKRATFSTRCRNKHHRRLRKLKKLNRVSETCQLLFN
ncbi:putative FBD-associated F-box protein At5g56560 [Brassica rapa]|uniref:putative FBD-associated F-box protein At5g56560 n=1 Tax=Brassica campestris TaxID=3711 RepID=UPI0004F18831|nr:putative FBD-associated F-box protein At5g56560 [Brassica rapa]